MEYIFKRLLEREIFNQRCIDKIDITEKENHTVLTEMANNSIDQMEDIIEIIYEQYPESRGICLNDLIYNILYVIGEDNVRNFDTGQLKELAELVIDCVVDFIEGYCKIAGGG